MSRNCRIKDRYARRVATCGTVDDMLRQTRFGWSVGRLRRFCHFLERAPFPVRTDDPILRPLSTLSMLRTQLSVGSRRIAGARGESVLSSAKE